MYINQTDAQKNTKLQAWISFLSGIVFLIPVITLFYKYTGLELVDIILISNISTLTIWLFELPTSVFADTLGRKRSLVLSVFCNLLSALTIFLFPSYTGFIVAAVFGGLYRSFRSGTGQAFLEDNLKATGEEKKFGKSIGHLMSLESFAATLTPIIVALILKLLGDSGYTVLAALDVLFALILFIITTHLKEPLLIQEKFQTIKETWTKSYQVTKNAINNIFSSTNLKLLLIYRSLANHVAFFFIVSLPVLVDNGMEEWMGGIIVAVAGLALMISNKYAYKVGEKKSYNFAWVISTIAQAILLIIAGLVLQSWILLAIVFILFNFFEGLWMPARNHVLVEQTGGISIATTRSIVFSIFALYTTLGKQLLSWLPVEYALIGSGIFILLINIFFAKKILAMKIE